MAPPEEITAHSELINVSQFTEAVFDGTDDLVDDAITPHKRRTSTQSTQAANSDETSDEESLLAPTAPKKPRATTNHSSHDSLTASSLSTSTGPSNARGGPVATNRSCPEYWLAHGNKASYLLLMCIGLKGQAEPSFCVVNEDPNYKTRKDRSKFKPTKLMFISEVQRRHKLYHGGDKEKKCASHTVTQLQAYLVSHPIFDPDDVQFLLQQEKKFREGLDSAEKERTDLAELHSGEDAWIGNLPWLRLYHVMIADRVKESYNRLNEWETREGTDARNSEIRPKSFYEVASDLYNNTHFCPKSFLYPNLHESFSDKHDLSLGPSIPEASADKIKKKLAEARAKLMKLIADWEKSGNGCGQRGEGTATFGHIVEDQLWLNVDGGQDTEEEFMDGDNRASFLQGRRPHLLYMWELFDEYHMLDQTMNKLSTDCSAGANHTPSALAPTNKNQEKKTSVAKQHAELLHVQERTAQSMRKIAESQECSQIVAMENTLIKLQDRLMSQVVQNNEQYKKDFEDQVVRVKRQLDELYAKSSKDE